MSVDAGGRPVSPKGIPPHSLIAKDHCLNNGRMGGEGSGGVAGVWGLA